MTTLLNIDISIRPLERDDLAMADRICRLAFGTYLGVPEPETFFGDTAYVATRYEAPNTVALAAEIEGEIVGSNFVTHWGELGFFGPLSVRVDLWDRGIASALMDATVDVFSRWGTRHAALFTWADSPKHHGLYQKFGFYPTFLTAVMSKSVSEAEASDWSVLSHSPELLERCREVADAVHPGLDLAGEIDSVTRQQLGDVVLTDHGFAVCHVGAGTEAGSGTCFVKFAAVRPGADAADTFVRLMCAVEAFAVRAGAERLVAGVNMGRLDAYRILGARGFRTDLTGVAMQQRGEVAYNRPDRYVIDDWR